MVYRKPGEEVPVPHDAAVTRGKGLVWGRHPPHPKCWWLGAEGASRTDDVTEGWDPKPLPPLLFKPMQIIHVHIVREYFSAEFEMVKQRFVNKRLAAQSASKAATASASPPDAVPGGCVCVSAWVYACMSMWAREDGRVSPVSIWLHEPVLLC